MVQQHQAQPFLSPLAGKIAKLSHSSWLSVAERGVLSGQSCALTPPPLEGEGDHRALPCAVVEGPPQEIFGPRLQSHPSTILQVRAKWSPSPCGGGSENVHPIVLGVLFTHRTPLQLRLSGYRAPPSLRILSRKGRGEDNQPIPDSHHGKGRAPVLQISTYLRTFVSSCEIFFLTRRHEGTKKKVSHQNIIIFVAIYFVGLLTQPSFAFDYIKLDCQHLRDVEVQASMCGTMFHEPRIPNLAFDEAAAEKYQSQQIELCKEKHKVTIASARVTFAKVHKNRILKYFPKFIIKNANDRDWDNIIYRSPSICPLN